MIRITSTILHHGINDADSDADSDVLHTILLYCYRTVDVSRDIEYVLHLIYNFLYLWEINNDFTTIYIPYALFVIVVCSRNFTLSGWFGYR